MKQKLLNLTRLRSLLLLACVMLGMSAWGDEIVAYTLTPSAGSDNGYATAEDIEVNGITWNITGNTTMIPWRIGGKNLNNANRALYSKAPIEGDITKIEVKHGGASSVTVNSWTVVVSKNADFSSPVSTLTPTFTANATTTISRPADVDWSNCYFKFIYAVTIGSSNKFIEFTEAKFYKETGTTLITSDLSVTPTNLSFDLSNDNSAKTVTCTTSSTGAITVSGGTGFLTTSVSGTTITVTPIAVTSEAQTITVSQAADNTYSAGTASFTVTITGPIEITPNYTFWGKTAQFSGSTYSDLSGSYGGVTLNWSRGNGSTYANQSAMRFYKDNTLTFTAPLNKVITRIVFAQSNEGDDMTSAPEGYTSTNKTWEGSAEAVSFTRPSNASGYMTFTKITVVISDLPSIAAPTFSVPTGTYTRVQSVEITCADADATIYYTTDGTYPSATNGTQYTSAITIDETTTLKAIAIKNGETSGITIATYTMNLPLTTIAAAKQLDNNTSFELDLTGAQIVYIDNAKKNIYVRDATGAIDLYNNNNSGFNTTLQTGDILSGIIAGTYTLYGNYIPEIKDISNISDLTSTSNSTVVATVINCTTEDINANICDLVKIENKTITGGSTSGYYIDDVQVYDNFGVGYSVTTGKNVDVSGIALRYNNNYEISPRFASDIVYLDDAETVSITAAGLATFSSTKALDFTGADAVEAYTATVSSTGQITYSRIYKVPANTGLVVRSTQGGAVSINVPELTGDADVIAANDLVAVSQTIEQLASTNEDGTTNYILNIVNDKLGFYKANNKKVAAGKAYLKAGVDESRSFIGVDDMTGIESIAATVSDGQYYDLQGRRVAQPQKGLYIVNGKKVIIK